MNSRAKAVLYILTVIWIAACAMFDPDEEFVAIGDGLLVRRDGVVISVSDLPGAASAPYDLALPDASGPVAPWRPANLRLAQDW
jgi:hypothetical protein